MSKSSYVPFSMMGPDQKEKINAHIDRAYDVLDAIQDASMAAKENLMKTDFKIAAVSLNFIGRLLQAESAMLMAGTVMADRADKSADFREIIAKNLPEIQFPPKQLKK